MMERTVRVGWVERDFSDLVHHRKGVQPGIYLICQKVLNSSSSNGGGAERSWGKGKQVAYSVNGGCWKSGRGEWTHSFVKSRLAY